MKTHILLITGLSLIKLNEGFNNNIVDIRFGLKELVLDLSSPNISEQCGAREKCIWKCCPEGKIIGIFKACVKSDIRLPNITVYNKNHIPTNKTLQSVFNLVPNLMKDAIFARHALWWYKAYLTDDGRLFLKLPNVYNRWKVINSNHFCVEMKENKTRPVFMVEYQIDHPRNPSTYKKWALIISTVCLIMALVVYSVVRELRDLNGVILMIHLCCLIMTFITNCILENFNTLTALRMSEIVVVSFFHYFFKVSSFAWTNVMFYRLLMSSYRSKELPVSWIKQLTKYSAYAFGLPFFMTIFTATIELSDMSDSPLFVTPQVRNRGNFSFQEMESLYYLYFPLMVLLAFNWIVCFVKVIEFCKKSKQFSVVGARQADNEEFNRPMQFVKLHTLLTAYALVEMLTVIFLKGTHDTQAAYTMCIGPIVLVIFVWNKNVLSLFLKHLQTCKRQTANSNQFVTFFRKK